MHVFHLDHLGYHALLSMCTLTQQWLIALNLSCEKISKEFNKCFLKTAKHDIDNDDMHNNVGMLLEQNYCKSKEKWKVNIFNSF